MELIVILFGVIAFFVWRYVSETEASRVWNERQQEDALRAKRRQESAQQDELLVTLETSTDKSLHTFELLPNYLEQAEAALDQAESEFGERAFAPFWERIQDAAASLSQFDEGVRSISELSTIYYNTVPRYRGAVPPFPLSGDSLSRLRVGEGTAARLKSVVRAAQRDFQFASIYEQRKTNSILIAGFTTLGQALNSLEGRLLDSLDTLTNSVRDVADAVRDGHERLDGALQQMSAENLTFHRLAERRDGERRERERKAIEMLDNIQWRRRPRTQADY